MENKYKVWMLGGAAGLSVPLLYYTLSWVYCRLWACGTYQDTVSVLFFLVSVIGLVGIMCAAKMGSANRFVRVASVAGALLLPVALAALGAWTALGVKVKPKFSAGIGVMYLFLLVVLVQIVMYLVGGFLQRKAAEREG